ncbi:hypothetical protein LCGC14_0558010 [marine sediment metagenome]|uniref:Uncharacterized protein n=1 Tax=marine sediment metagenome TaxID=412755 RepID=A0A0F9UW72_9ZZZZ
MPWVAWPLLAGVVILVWIGIKLIKYIKQLAETFFRDIAGW